MSYNTSPLLNAYKRDFLWRRLLQTMSGGLRIPRKAPLHIYSSQLLLLSLPAIFGGAFTGAVMTGLLSQNIAIYVYGALMVFFVLFIQVLGLVAEKKSKCRVAPLEDKSLAQSMLAEEDDVDFSSCCGIKTLLFVIPRKRYKVNVMIHALLSGVMCGFGFWFLLPSNIGPVFKEGVVSTILFYITGWMIICLAQYSLTAAPPPETFVSRASDIHEMAPLTRPCYVLIVCSIHLLIRSWGITTTLLHVALVWLPMLWVLGILPHLDVLCLWVMEQGLIILLGGSAMATDLRLLVMSAVSVAAYVGVYFIPLGTHTTTLMSVLGYVLSIHLASLISKTMRRYFKQDTKSCPEADVNKEIFLWHWGIREGFFHLAVVVITGSIATGINMFIKGSDMSWGVEYSLIGMCVVEWTLSKIQQVYLCLALLRNPLYPKNVQRKASFDRGKERLQIAAKVRRVLINFIVPLTLVAYFASRFKFTEDSIDTLTVGKAFTILGSVRAYRWASCMCDSYVRKAWQNTSSCLREVSLLNFLLLVSRDTEVTWRSLGLPTQLLLVGFIYNRLGQLQGNLFTYVTVLVKSWSDRKQRRKFTPLIIALNILLFPLSLIVILIATALGAPVLPLFTLPVFLMGYPRPLRFWPEAEGWKASECRDTVYYRQAAPGLARAFSVALASGSMGEVKVGSHFLLRFQDRLAWLQVLERGHAYCCIIIRGLELQDTSCHALEAAAVDELLEHSFEQGAGGCVCNPSPLSILQPRDAAYVKLYSDARSHLTGVLDSTEVLQGVAAGFRKTLVWLLLQYAFDSKEGQDCKPTEEKSGSLGSLQDGIDPTHSGLVSQDQGKTEDTMRNISKTIISKSPDGERSQSSSNRSFTDSIWGSDDSDSLFTEHHGPRIQSPHTGTLPPHQQASNLDDFMNDALEDFEFAMPTTDFPHGQDRLFSDTGKSKAIPVYQPNKMITNLPASKYLTLPTEWNQLPMEYHLLQKCVNQFPEDWYKYVISKFDYEAYERKEPTDIAQELSKDRELKKSYTEIVMICQSIVNDPGVSGGRTVHCGSAHHIQRVYKGDLPWSPALEWLTQRPQLQQLVLQAYRMAVKLALDEAVLGPIDTPAELHDYLVDLQQHWYLGSQEDPAWTQEVEDSTPHLFSLHQDPTQGTYRSRQLSLQDIPMFISSLNAECVHAQWANLSLELLYFTNDDDERYSIQTHTSLLRNLTVQAASPPLGYPIYASPLFTVPTL